MHFEKITACLQFVEPQVQNVKQLIFKRENTAFTPNNHGSCVQKENSYKCISWTEKKICYSIYSFTF